MNNILKKNNTMYTNTYPNDIYEDNINSIKKTVINKTLNISSIFRKDFYSSTSSDFIYELPINIENVVSLKVIEIQLPPIIYNISSYIGNNFFLIKNQTTFETKKITIPDNLYTNETLIAYLNYLFDSFTDEFKHIHFTMLNDGQTMIGLKNTTPYIYNFILEFDNDFIENIFFSNYKKQEINQTTVSSLSSKLGWILGFRYDCYQNKSIYISEGVINTSYSTMYLCVDDYNENNQNNIFLAFNKETPLSNNIVSEIYLQNNDSTNIKINSIKKIYFSPVNLRKLNIKLIDQWGKIVSVNNDDLNFTLSLETIYS